MVKLALRSSVALSFLEVVADSVVITVQVSERSFFSDVFIFAFVSESALSDVLVMPAWPLLVCIVYFVLVLLN